MSQHRVTIPTVNPAVTRKIEVLLSIWTSEREPGRQRDELERAEGGEDREEAQQPHVGVVAAVPRREVEERAAEGVDREAHWRDGEDRHVLPAAQERDEFVEDQ